MCHFPKYFDNIRNPWTGELYPVPCHHCQGCRIDRRVMWDRRITSEFVKLRSAFVTFTYDEYHVNYNPGSVYPTVRNSDFGRFVDSLRHNIRYHYDSLPEFNTFDWKFVACSEYGDSHTQRPHFHALFLGLDWKEFNGLFKHYWKNGIVDVGPILSGGINYVLKYMDKQVNGPMAHELYTDFGRDIPKMMFSPGIGKDWFISQVPNMNKYGCAKVGQRLIPIPSYWKNKLFNYCDENIYRIEKQKADRLLELDSQARSFGYDSYDSFLRDTRRNMEKASENKLRRDKIPFIPLSDMIPDKRLPPLSELFLNYRPSVLQKLLDRPVVFA